MPVHCMQQLSNARRKLTLLAVSNTRITAVLFIVATCSALMSEAYLSYRAEVRKAAESADTLSLLISERLMSDIRAVDTLLGNLADTVTLPVQGDIPGDMEIRIHRQLALTPVADNLSLVTAAGQVAYARIGRTGARVDAQSWFGELRRYPDGGSVFSNVHPSPSNGLPVVSIAHALWLPGRRFGGAAVADLDFSYFQRLLQNVNVGAYGSLLLLHESGQLVAGMPELPEDVGRRYPLPTEAIGPRLESAQGWTALGRLPRETEQRMISVRRLTGMPFVVVVGLSDRDYLAAWRAKIGIHSIFILCLSVLTFALERMLVRERRRTLELARSQQKLEQSRQQLQTVIQTAPIALAITEPDSGHVMLANRTMAQVLGADQNNIEGRSLCEFCAEPGEANALVSELAAAGSIAQREVQVRCADGAARWLLVDAAAIEFDDRPAVIIGGKDITERKALEHKLVELATADALTGLANRRHFVERAEAEFKRARRGGHALAVLMIDIDRFKQINDGHGHAAGDSMIRHVAQQIRSKLRAIDIAGRLGGDEFAVILPDTTADKAMFVARRICEDIEHGQLELDGTRRLQVSVSVGVAALQEGDAEFGALLNRADEALYSAKGGGRNQAACAA